MNKFEQGKQYDLHFKSKPWNESAGKVEVAEIKYFSEPVEIRGNKINEIAQIGEAVIKYIDTKFYKNKLFNIPVVGYFKSRCGTDSDETSCLSLDNKFYFPVFLD